jgi:beta-glucosidase-like glycosyl hydrolase
MPIQDGTPVISQPCVAGNSAQQFTAGVNNTILAASNPQMCVNVANYGTTPWSQVWLYQCDPGGNPQGNCNWLPGPNSSLVNLGSGLCLFDGVNPPPPLPYTCAEGSPSYALPFCDYTLPVEQRVADLLARMDLPTRVQQFSIAIGRFQYHAALNLKEFLWDLSCIHGINSEQASPGRNSTVYPHAIALAASFDLDLIARVAQATAEELRIINQLNYEWSGGTSWQGTSCDGGPLANSVHDPRWGRTSECFGEDVTLASAVGVTMLTNMQNRSADGRWLLTSQVTRHYLGYHEATDLPNGGQEYIDLFSFADQQEPIYRAFQVDGMAEGLMCAMSAFSIGPANSTTAPLIPSCVHPFLWAKLRDEWQSDCVVQSDCCDSISEMVEPHHYYPDLATALTSSIAAGVAASFGPSLAIDQTVTALLQNGTLDMGLFETRLSRTLLTRFRLGEFDIGRNPDYPYSARFNESDLVGPAHIALAREAVGKSAVLLNNTLGLLPFKLQSGAAKTIAVIGPFASCLGVDESGGASNNPLTCSYVHSYAGQASYISTILGAAQEEATANGWTVTYAQGSSITVPFGSNNSGINAAVAVAQAADVVVLAVGLSTMIEEEGVDRTTLLLPDAQQALVDAIAATAGAKTVLVIVSAGMVDTAGYSTMGASLQVWYGGQETGHGLMDVLFGRVNPSARLPITAYREEYLSIIDPIASFNMITSQGTGRTYRFLNETAQGGAVGSLVRYWFGYGLSYSSFAYSNLSVALVSPLPPAGAPASTTPLAVVTVYVANTGTVAGSEVVQVYVSVPNNANVSAMIDGAPVPLYSLAAFTKVVDLQPGAPPVPVQLTLPLRTFETTTLNGARIVTGGDYTVCVSGHMPADPHGPANMLTTVVTL